MTEEAFNDKFREMAARVPAMLEEFRRAALASGGLDLANAADDYWPAAITLTAALRDVSEQFEPVGRSNSKEVINVGILSYPDYARLR